MGKFKFKFLDRFKKSPPEDAEREFEEDVEHSSHEEEGETADTTSGEIYPEYREHQKSPSPEGSDFEAESAVEEEDASEEDFSTPPEKPSLAHRLKIRFPKFNLEKTRTNIRLKLRDATSMKSIDKFNWNDFVLRIFSPYSRIKVHGIFIISLVVILTYLTGKAIALFLNRQAPLTTSIKSTVVIPPRKVDNTAADLKSIASSNLFNVKESDKAQEVAKVKKDIKSIVCLESDQPSKEALKLLDTIVLQDSIKSVASVQVRDEKELLNVREGDQLNSSYQVSKINRMRVILKNMETGDCEYIANQEDPTESILPPLNILSPKKAQSLFKSNNPDIKNKGNSFTIKRQFRDKMITNMSEVLTQAKAIQITNPDGSFSFKMTEIVPGSIYSQLNIQNDDVINSINGKKIENLNELVNMMGRIKEVDQFQIGLKRNGMNENLEYNFE